MYLRNHFLTFFYNFIKQLENLIFNEVSEDLKGWSQSRNPLTKLQA